MHSSEHKVQSKPSARTRSSPLSSLYVFPLLPDYTYHKDERALPGNLQSLHLSRNSNTKYRASHYSPPSPVCSLQRYNDKRTMEHITKLCTCVFHYLAISLSQEPITSQALHTTLTTPPTPSCTALPTSHRHNGDCLPSPRTTTMTRQAPPSLLPSPTLCIFDTFSVYFTCASVANPTSSTSPVRMFIASI
jgi:hypothetical protein